MKRGSIYPSWRYHKTDPPVLCADAAHDAELGDEWSDADIRDFTSAPAAAEATTAPAEDSAPKTPKAVAKKRGTRKK